MEVISDRAQESATAENDSDNQPAQVAALGDVIGFLSVVRSLVGMPENVTTSTARNRIQQSHIEDYFC